MQSNIQQNYPGFYTFYESHFFSGQTPVPPRSGTWILDLSHDPTWAIWLAGVRKFHQHHGRIQNIHTFGLHSLNSIYSGKIRRSSTRLFFWYEVCFPTKTSSSEIISGDKLGGYCYRQSVWKASAKPRSHWKAGPWCHGSQGNGIYYYIWAWAIFWLFQIQNLQVLFMTQINYMKGMNSIRCISKNLSDQALTGSNFINLTNRYHDICRHILSLGHKDVDHH